MTSIVSRVVIETLPGTPGQALAAATGGILAAILVGLLIVRQLVQTAGRPHWREIVWTLDVAAIPLLIAFAVIVYERLQDLMPLG